MQRSDTLGRLGALAALLSACSAAASDYFAIQVVDDETGRGVPLVELRTVNGVRHYTDSAGLVAFLEPGLMDRQVHFAVSSHGYEYPADGFGFRGARLDVRPGGQATLRIRRVNIAERLYRVTGGGIYRDSVLLGRPVPISAPVLNGEVLGQDSVQNAVYRGKLYWFWGDTNWPRYPLGNFHMTGATSLLPGDGGLKPSDGVDLTYFVRENGFAKEMAPRPEPGPVWLDAFVTLRGDGGREAMFAAYARVTASMEAVERGFMRYNDETGIFEKVVEFDVKTPVFAGGHPFVHSDDSVEYLWFPTPFPLVRVRAEAAAYLDVDQYEAWTPLKDGTDLESAVVDRDAAGRIRYAWRRGTPALDQPRQDALIAAGKLKPHEAWTQLRDVDSGKPVLAHAGSVYWNEYRGRWITIRCESLGTSVLGETWYAEADTPLGPWVYARKIVTHDRYSFYNPKQHPEFDEDGGRILYFEGTYTSTFSGTTDPTPRYDYNQIMYRLNLADERLALPAPVYPNDAQHADAPFSFRRAPATSFEPQRIAFFAQDRPTKGAVAVRWQRGGGGAARLVASPATPEDAADSSVVFFALPPETPEPPGTTAPLHSFRATESDAYRYSTDPREPAGFRRETTPVCRVWRDPMLP